MSTNIIDQKFFKNTDNNVFCIDIMQMNQETWESGIQDGWLEISKETALLMTQMPSKYHQWQDETQSWLISIENQELLKLDERAALPDITQKQLRLTLIQNGIMPDQVETQIAAIPDDDKHTRLIAQTEWQYAQSFERMSENLNMIAKDLLGMDDVQIDTMWQQAMQL